MCRELRISKTREVETELDADKLDAPLAACSDIAIYYWQQDSRITLGCCVRYDGTIDVVKAQYCETIKVVPIILKVPDPVVDHPVHRCQKVQLVT